MLQTLDLVTQPYPSVWHHFPLIIYQSQTQNPKRSNELTKAKCELCLTSRNLQFHFSTESPASLCVTSQSWKLTASWIWPDFDHLSRHIVIISKTKPKQNNANILEKMPKFGKSKQVAESILKSEWQNYCDDKDKDIGYDGDNAGVDDDDGDKLGLAWPLRHETTTSGILASSHSKSSTRQAVLPFQHDRNEDGDDLTMQFFSRWSTWIKWWLTFVQHWFQFLVKFILIILIWGHLLRSIPSSISGWIFLNFLFVALSYESNLQLGCPWWKISMSSLKTFFYKFCAYFGESHVQTWELWFSQIYMIEGWWVKKNALSHSHFHYW